MAERRPDGPVRVLLASHNAGKVAEMQRILAPAVPGVVVVGLDALTGLGLPSYDEPVEDAPDFVGNALIKARAAAAATGLPAVADDSGLCVDALNGMPGVLSARWSGRRRSEVGREAVDAANNALLLAQLEDVPQERRTARFACAVALVVPGGAGEAVEVVVEGEMPGRVVRSPRGAGGFGYDVVFVADEHVTDGPEDAWRTTAQLDPPDKDAISHRGRALRALAPRAAQALLGG